MYQQNIEMTSTKSSCFWWCVKDQSFIVKKTTHFWLAGLSFTWSDLDFQPNNHLKTLTLAVNSKKPCTVCTLLTINDAPGKKYLRKTP